MVAAIAERTAGVTALVAGVGVALACFAAAGVRDEQALAATRIRASAQSNLVMVLGRVRRAARGRIEAMLARVACAGTRAGSRDQNVSHQQRPDWVTPKSRVKPSVPPVETSKPVGGGKGALEPAAGPLAEAAGPGPLANGGPVG